MQLALPNARTTLKKKKLFILKQIYMFTINHDIFSEENDDDEIETETNENELSGQLEVNAESPDSNPRLHRIV